MRILALATLLCCLSPKVEARSVIDCEEAYRAMMIWELDDIIEHHGYYRSTTETENARFENALNDPANYVWGVAHFDIANLKWQNDKGIKNKQVVNALENLYRKGLFMRIKEDPLLSRYLIEEASNFKTSRFAFTKVPPEHVEKFEFALNRAAEQAALAQEKFGKSYLAFDPPTLRRIRKGGDANSRIGRWHSGGFTFRTTGMTGQELADVSALRSRLGRENIDAQGKTLPFKTDSDGAVETLVEFQKTYRDAFAALEGRYGNHPKIFEMDGNDKILSQNLMDLIRKHPDPKQLSIAIKNSFLMEINDLPLLQKLIDAEKMANVFAPSINNVKRVIPMPEGYTISFDIKGVGAKNSQMLVKHLNKVSISDTPGEEGIMNTVLGAVRAARLSEQEATVWVEKIKKHVVDATGYGAITNSDDDVKFTGDDGMANRSRPFQHKSVDLRRIFLQGLISNSPVPANKLRMVMIGPEYSGSKVEIPVATKFDLISSFEGMLKDTDEFYNPEHLSVSVSIDPKTPGGGGYRLYITGEKVTKQEIEKIKRLVRKNAPPGFVASADPEVIEFGIHR